jgi:hypothetical protein
MSQVKQLELLYKNVKRVDRALTFVADDHLVFANCTAEVFQDGSNIKFTLSDLRILNTDPMSVFIMSVKLQTKVKDLVNHIEKKRMLDSVKNDDFQSIMAIFPRKRSKLSSQDEAQKPKLEYERPQISNSGVVNPLFCPPQHTQPGSSDSFNFETQFLETQHYDFPQPTACELPSQKEEPNEDPPYPQKWDDDHSSFVQVEKSTSFDLEHSHRSRPRSTNENVLADSQMEPANMEQESSSASSDENEEDHIDTRSSAIEDVMNDAEFAYGEIVHFPGFIVGIDPYDLKIFSSSFQGQVKARGFRLIISNRLDLGIFEMNKNCLALEVDQDDVYTFLGVDQTKLGNLDVMSQLHKLLTGEKRRIFRIARARRLTGVPLDVWECRNTLKDLLE